MKFSCWYNCSIGNVVRLECESKINLFRIAIEAVRELYRRTIKPLSKSKSNLVCVPAHATEAGSSPDTRIYSNQNRNAFDRLANSNRNLENYHPKMNDTFVAQFCIQAG